MRVSRVQSQETERRIVRVAHDLFSRFGFDGVGIATIMKAAGLTQGGFYCHFADKDDLITQASKLGFELELQTWNSVAAGEKVEKLYALIDHYLPEVNELEQSRNCPLVCLVGDAARAPKSVAAVFSSGMDSYLEFLDSEVFHEQGKHGSDSGLQLLSQLVGAAILSRSVSKSSPELARRILAANRAQLRGHLENTARRGPQDQVALNSNNS